MTAKNDGDAPVAGSKRKPGLGRGLDALLGEMRGTPSANAADGAESGRGDGQGLRKLAIGLIAPHPGQPRRFFDEAALDELAQSIEEHGILQPIVVRPSGKGYQIVAGERRWRAAQRARLHEVPAIVRDVSDDQLLELALIENIQRADLTPIEEAEAYRALIDRHGHTTTDLARRIDKSRSHVANMMRLLDLPAAVRTMVSQGALSMGHARPLIGLPESDAVDIAETVVRDGLSVRAVEALLRKRRKPARLETKAAATSAGETEQDLAAIERHVGELLGLRVSIAPTKQGSGNIAIYYNNLEQLDMVIERLTGLAL